MVRFGLDTPIAGATDMSSSSSSSSSTEHSVLIALRELDSLEQQRREQLAARERARLAAEAAALAAADAQIRAELAARLRAEAEAQAAAEAERARQAQILRLRDLEVAAEVQRERDARLFQVQREIDGQLRQHSRRELAGQRAVGAVLLAVLGLAGALGGMVLTQPRTSVIELAVAGANDLRHMAALEEYTAAVSAIEHDLGRLRSDNDRQEAVVEAAAALRAMMKEKLARQENSNATVRPARPRPSAPADKKPPTSGKIKVCDVDDPLAEDC